MCGGHKSHTASCYSVRIFERQRDRPGASVNKQTGGHCVHDNRHIDAWLSNGQMLRSVLNHLRAHRKPEDALRFRLLSAYKLTIKRTRKAKLKLSAPKVSEAPPDLQPRVNAFAEASKQFPVEQLTHRLAAPAGYRVSAIGFESAACKPGAAYSVGDGVAQCILRIDTEFDTAFVAELHRNDVCTRAYHEGPCWSYARRGKPDWMRMAALGRHRVCFSPRFSARSHLTPKLEKLCFKQVRLGYGEGAWTRQTRLHKVFEGAGVTLTCAEARMLADMAPETCAGSAMRMGLSLIRLRCVAPSAGIA